MINKIIDQQEYRGTIIQTVKGDITKENVDVIVNAANSQLIHGGGVAGAIVREGGEIIQEESDKIGYVPVGNAVITSAGRLKAKYVIHTVGPRWGEGDEEKKLEQAVLNALKLMKEKKLKKISLPAISTGIFGFPKEKGVRIILKTIKKFIEKNRGEAKVIRCISIDDKTATLFKKSTKKIFIKEE